MKILIIALVIMGTPVARSNSTYKMLRNINDRKVDTYEITENTTDR